MSTGTVWPPVLPSLLPDTDGLGWPTDELLPFTSVPGLGLAASGQQGEHQGRRQGSAESFHVYSSLHCVSAPALPWLKFRRG